MGNLHNVPGQDVQATIKKSKTDQEGHGQVIMLLESADGREPVVNCCLYRTRLPLPPGAQKRPVNRYALLSFSRLGKHSGR